MFFFNDTATTEIYTLSLHDALPICRCDSNTVFAPARSQWVSRSMQYDRASSNDIVGPHIAPRYACGRGRRSPWHKRTDHRDRKSTRLNSSHANISYAVFCLKKKKIQ